MTEFEKRCRQFLETELPEAGDSAHDIQHILRVVKNAKMILGQETADVEIVTAAAWLHDCVVLPKNHPERKKASAMAAERAGKFLAATAFPQNKIRQVEHAIKAHSFSAGIFPDTTEAKVVQDADRLDALGAIGIARCLMIGGNLNRPLYHAEDPLSEHRTPDDNLWTIDHFYTKLFRLHETMHTEPAKKEAEKRISFMKKYLQQFKNEI